MARQHGADCRVYLGGYDRSGDLSEVTPKFAADTHDVTTFASANWKENVAGLLGWECGLTGFYDPAAAGYGRHLEDILGASCLALSIYDGDANAQGDTGILLGPGLLAERDQPQNVADMIRLNGAITGYGRAGMFGKLLHVLGAETTTAVGDPHSHGASTANGGRANLHVTAITGTWTIKIQHSADNNTYADLLTFTQVAAAGGVTAESKEVTGTVNQYLRVVATEDVAGTISFVCGFARY